MTVTYYCKVDDHKNRDSFEDYDDIYYYDDTFDYSKLLGVYFACEYYSLKHDKNLYHSFGLLTPPEYNHCRLKAGWICHKVTNEIDRFAIRGFIVFDFKEEFVAFKLKYS